MGGITLENTSSLLSTFSLYLSLGVGIFAVSMVILIFLFGWSLKDTLKNTRGIIALLVITLLGTMTFSQLSNKNIPSALASIIMKITQVETSLVEDKTVKVMIVTSSSADGYLEYTDYSRNEKDVILPNISGLSNKHIFYIYNIGAKGGEAVLIVNNKKILFNGKPIFIIL